MAGMLALMASIFPGSSISAEPAPSSQVRAYVRAQGWAYSQPVPIDAYIEDWDAPLGSGSDAFGFLHAESGVVWDGWRVGIAFQRQYVIEANRDAARLYHLERSDAPAPPNTTYDVRLEAHLYSARGIRIGRDIQLPTHGDVRITLSPSIVAWEASALENGSINGVATTNADGELTYQASLDHTYSKDHLLDRPVGDVRGRGASFDLDATIAVPDRWSLELTTTNLLGRLWWRDAPYTTGQLDSDTRQSGSDGGIKFNPTLRGFEGNASYRQRMPLFAYAAFRRVWGPYDLGLSLTHTDIDTFPGIRAGHHVGALRYGLEWLPTAQDAFRVEVGVPGLSFQLGSNAGNWKDAEHLQVRLLVEVPLWGRRAP